MGRLRRLVFDADSLIKLARAGLLEEAVRAFECHVTSEVERESVTAGKERMHEDASVIEQVIRAGSLPVHHVRVPERSESRELGRGELSAQALARAIEADAVVSDDRKFLAFLEEEGEPYLTPTQLLLLLVRVRVLPPKRALAHLERLRPWIRESAYRAAREELEGDEK